MTNKKKSFFGSLREIDEQREYFGKMSIFILSKGIFTIRGILTSKYTGGSRPSCFPPLINFISSKEIQSSSFYVQKISNLIMPNCWTEKFLHCQRIIESTTKERIKFFCFLVYSIFVWRLMFLQKTHFVLFSFSSFPSW